VPFFQSGRLFFDRWYRFYWQLWDGGRSWWWFALRGAVNRINQNFF